MSNPSNCHVWHWTSDLNLYMHIPVYYQSKYVIIIVVVFEMNVMYIDCVYGCYIRVYWLCIWCYIHVYWLRIWVLYTCILIAYMGAIYMSFDCVYGCYLHVYRWCVWVLHTYIFIVYMGVMYIYVDGVYGCYVHVYLLCMGAICMYTDCVYGCYIHAYWLGIWVLYTCILIVYMGAIIR